MIPLYEEIYLALKNPLSPPPRWHVKEYDTGAVATGSFQQDIDAPGDMDIYVNQLLVSCYGGGAQTILTLRADIYTRPGTASWVSLISLKPSTNTVQAIMRDFVVPAGMRLRIYSAYSAAVAANQTIVDLHGVQLPALRISIF